VTWRYSQSTGDLEHVVDGSVVVTVAAAGYSGHQRGLNNPELEGVRSVGPIPRGLWRIGAPFDSDALGPFVLPLTRDPHEPPLDRHGFAIHGDNYQRNRSASHGCIVMARRIREMIHDEDDAELEVVT
jgi:hypothetical protein